MPAVTRKEVREMIASSKVVVETIGVKTTVVHCTLPNGFEIVESSSCVRPEDYAENVGKAVCMEKISNKVWELLGFLRQQQKFEAGEGK